MCSAVRCCAASRAIGHLEDLARLLQMLRRVARIAQQQRHRFDDVIRGQRGHERPAPHVHLHQPLLGERLDRLAHRRAAHAEVRRQLPFGGDAVAGLEFTREDLRLHVLHDLLEQALLGADRIERDGHVRLARRAAHERRSGYHAPSGNGSPAT
jgi:hypothetical protein